MGRIKVGYFAGLGGDSTGAAAGTAVTGMFAEVAETAAEGVWWKRSAWGWTDRDGNTALRNKSRNLISFRGGRENGDSSDMVYLNIGVALEVRETVSSGIYKLKSKVVVEEGGGLVYSQMLPAHLCSV